jgi:hypothetical protein
MRTLCATALLCFWLPSTATAQNAESRPAEPQSEVGPQALNGAQVVLAKCTECHSLRPVFRANYDREGWNDAVSRMIGEGLEINDAQRWAAIDYLTEAVCVPEAERRGQPHFALVHFPIALIVAWVLVELWGVWRREPLAVRWAGGLLGWLTVCGAGAAMLTGFWLEHDRTTMPAEMAWHMNLGMASFVLTLSAALTRAAAARWTGRGWKFAYAGLLALALASVNMTGHLGGLMVHGDVLKSWFAGP